MLVTELHTSPISSFGPKHTPHVSSQGCIEPFCELLTLLDAKIIQVALNGLENILKLGEEEAKQTGSVNPYVVLIEECYGLDKIEFLQSHENIEIYQKAFDIIEHYFGSEEEDTRVAPCVTHDASGAQEFTFAGATQGGACDSTTMLAGGGGGFNF